MNGVCLSYPLIEWTDRHKKKSSSLMDLARAKLLKYQTQKESEIQYFDCSAEVLDIVFSWFEIALAQGHIESSQQSAGRLVGWPVRQFSIHSLLVDFQIWCTQKNCEKKHRERDELFKLLCKRIFIVDGSVVCFPSLDKCREKFLQIKKLNDKESSNDKFKADRS